MEKILNNNMNLQSPITIKTNLLTLEKSIKRIENQIKKTEDEEKLIKLTLKKSSLKKEYKNILNQYNSYLEKESENLFNNLTFNYAKTLAFKNRGLISKRGEHDIDKWTYYYSGIDYEYKASILYYMIIAYAINLMISKQKRINRYIKINEDGVLSAIIFCDTLDYYYKKEGYGKYIAYIKRLLNK